MIHLAQCFQSVIRNCYHTHVRVDGTEGIVGGFCSRLGQGIEKCALSHVGKTYDTQLHFIFTRSKIPL